ncbi:MAG: serine/threonine-protein phosphatase, partial [Chitinophagaceae bacterium]|nr:serine/threonine-protein phosphatase [Chitinophagaceae bacterium]
KVTKDHSFVGFLEDSKRLSEEQAMRHPKRNEINKALGFDSDIESIADYIETGVSPFLPGDILLLCSDGLSDMIDSKTMASILATRQSLQKKVNRLIDAANHAGGRDNITVVLVHNNNKPVAQQATRPVIKKKSQKKDSGKEEVATYSTKSRRSSLGLVIFLILVCLTLAGALAWQWKQNQNERPVQPIISKKIRNAAEQKLTDNIANTRNKTLSLYDTVYGKTISISDTIFIQQDTLHVMGNDVVLRSDTLFKGPAFYLRSYCKYVLLENLILENFDVGIIAESKSIILKNVRFHNCSIPVQYHFLLPGDNYINGSISDTVFHTDSIPKLYKQ